MTKLSLSAFQQAAAKGLRRVYPEVAVEWRAITNIEGLYSPRVDIAVGPFSTIRGEDCISEYDQLMDNSRSFINSLLRHHRQNIEKHRTRDAQLMDALYLPDFDGLKDANRNARCLFAIEIENRVTRKHLLGGAVNAAALGRLGIVVGWTHEKLRALIKLQAYWDFLGAVGKNTFKARNLVILQPAQLLEAVRNSPIAILGPQITQSS